MHARILIVYQDGAERLAHERLVSLLFRLEGLSAEHQLLLCLLDSFCLCLYGLFSGYDGRVHGQSPGREDADGVQPCMLV